MKTKADWTEEKTSVDVLAKLPNAEMIEAIKALNIRGRKALDAVGVL